MTINRFRGDALPRPKIIKLLGPGGAGVVQAEITCGNRTFFFPLWNAINVAATLNSSGVPEFNNVLFSALGDDVVATGPEDDDFIIGLAYRPTVNITNNYGVDRVNQISALNFNGAQAGTYTLTINGKTTGTITYGNQVDLITEIELLSGWTASDAIVRSATPDQILIEFAGTLAGIPVSVTMDASNLQNGRTMTVRERSPYRAEPHDIWLLGMEASDTCTITIDGNSATLRSDFGLEKTREIIQSLATRAVNVYGGYIAPTGRVAPAHYVLDFHGYDISTRPTVVLYGSVASPKSAVTILSDAVFGVSGWNGITNSVGSITISTTTHGVPSTAAVNMTQTIKIPVTADGTFRLTSAGNISGSVPIGANAASVATAVESLSNIGAGNCTVTKTTDSNYDTYVLTFVGALSGLSVSPCIAEVTSLKPIVLTDRGGTGSLNEIQTVDVGSGASKTFTLTFSGQTTASIGTGNAASLVKNALEALSNVTSVDVTRDVNGKYTIEFTGVDGLADQPQMTASTYASGQSYHRIVPSSTTSATAGIAGVNEVQVITSSGAGASFSLHFAGETTGEIPYSATAATVDAALEGLSTIGAGNVTVTGSASGPWTVTFIGTMAAANQSQITPASNGLSTLGFARMMMLDFTAGSTIGLSYDGVEFDVENAIAMTSQATLSDLTTHKTAVDFVLTTMRDVSEYFEGNLILTGFKETNWLNTGSGPAANSSYHPGIYYILDDNGTLHQTGGDGTLRLLQQAGSASAPAVHEVFVPPRTTGGTFTLTFPEGKTAAISATASAATIETALDTLIAAGMGVAGSGTSASPWVITYTTALGARQLPIADDIALSGNGTGSASYYRLPVRSKNQSARIAISSNATGGTYKIAFGNDGPLTLTFGDSASTVDTALATLQGIGSAANVVTSYDAESQSYDLVFASALVNRKLPELKLISNNLDVTSTTTIEVSQQATGPQNLAEPQNWSANRVPHAGDTIVFESPVGDVRYGFRQWVQATANTTTEILTVAGGHDFRPGQVIRFLTSGTLPTGISAATDYYVLDPDNQNGTFRVSTTAAGGPVNISGAGSGEIFCGVLAAGVRIAGSFSDQIGRPERTTADSTEYLPRYLMIGLPSGGVCEIGAGVGRGSGLLRMDLGYSAGTVQLVRSDSSAETDRPAICLLSDSTLLAVDIVSADVGIAAHDGEGSTVGAVTQSAGTLYCGDVGVASIVKQGGRLLSRVMTVSGSVSIKG